MKFYKCLLCYAHFLYKTFRYCKANVRDRILPIQESFISDPMKLAYFSIKIVFIH